MKLFFEYDIFDFRLKTSNLLINWNLDFFEFMNLNLKQKLKKKRNIFFFLKLHFRKNVNSICNVNILTFSI